MPQARARPGRDRRSSGRPWTVTTIRIDAELFDEFRLAIDRDGETQRDFIEGAVRRELNRRARNANRKGAVNGGS